MSASRIGLGILAVFITFTLTGCFGKPIEGTWGFDTAEMEARAKKGPQDENSKEMVAQMVEAYGKVKVVITSDTITVTNPEGNSQKATYTIESENGNAYVIKTKDKDGEEKTVTLTVDGDKMTLEEKGGDGTTTMQLVRK